MRNERLGRRGHAIPAFFGIIVFLAVLCLLSATGAYAQEPAPPELSEADAAVLIDKAGNVLFSYNPTKKEHPASITKVMTAMVALDSDCKLSDVVTCAEPDLGDNSQMADFGEGDKATLGDLIRVMLVYSANDAAYNAAQFVAGSQEAFVEFMNKKAAAIGMEHTHFNNTHGLEDDDHYTCAQDMAIMTRYAMEHYPLISQTALLHTIETPVRGETYVFSSTDRLLDTFDGIRGLKTGAIVDNYTFLGASGRGNTQLYTAVLGCKTFMGRFDDAEALMEWGFANYTPHTFSRGSWTIRLHPYAYNFALKSVLHPAGDCNIKSWPSNGSCSYSTVLCRPYRLLEANAAYGWTNWVQSKSDLGHAVYTTQRTPVKASTWPVFTQPLFEETTNATEG